MLVFASLFSCQSKSENLQGEWYQIGFIKTNNTFYSSQNEAIKDNFIEFKNGKMTKLKLNSDQTFTLQTIYFPENTKEDSLKGTWKITNENLVLNVTLKNASWDGEFVIKKSDSRNLDLGLIKSIKKENNQIIENFSLAEKEKKWENIINKIGYEKGFPIVSEQKYRADDFLLNYLWEIRSFGKYVILRNERFDENTKYSEEIQDILNGYPWDYVPFYEPIFESSDQRLVFFDNKKMDFIYRDLSSQTGGCGTLAEGFYLVDYSFSEENKTLSFQFSVTESPPIELQILFFNKSPKKLDYKILAKNKDLVILEKIN